VEIFDQYAKNYDQWYERPFGSSAFGLEVACIRRVIGSFSLSLEVGVGSGRFAQALGISYGLDPSIELLKLAKQGGICGVLGRAEALPFKSSSFDLVLMVVSVCFFEEPLRAFKEAHRVLKNDGYLVLGLVLSDSPWADFYKEKAKRGHPIYFHARFYSFEELSSILAQTGFRVEKVCTTLFEEPQDQEPVKNQEIREGFWREGGFFCVSAKKIN
jgi:SAM-dependent methyltransferase